MFVIWAVMVPLIASSYLAGYLKRRRTGQAEGDWSFLRNRRALFGGTAAALLIAAPSLSSIRGFAFAIPASVLLGRVVAMTLNRYGPLAAHDDSAHRSDR